MDSVLVRCLDSPLCAHILVSLTLYPQFLLLRRAQYPPFHRAPCTPILVQHDVAGDEKGGRAF